MNEKTMRLKRIHKELIGFMNNPTNPRIKIFPNENDLFLWKVLIIGPPGSPYHKGVFKLTIRFGPGYPVVRPIINFVTNIHHLNIK